MLQWGAGAGRKGGPTTGATPGRRKPSSRVLDGTRRWSEVRRLRGARRLRAGYGVDRSCCVNRAGRGLVQDLVISPKSWGGQDRAACFSRCAMDAQGHGHMSDGELARPTGWIDGLSGVVRSAQEALGTDCGGITLLRDGGSFHSVGVTCSVVVTADRLQVELGEGPCVAVESRTVLSADIAGDARWPRWCVAVQRLGLCSVLSAQIRAGGVRVGALSLYGGQPRSFTRDEVALAQLFARQAATILGR